MQERKGIRQAKLPFVEPVVTRSLVTNETTVRMRRRKRLPGSETNFEMVQKADTWWSERGKLAFHQALKAWGNIQSDKLREVGESTPFFSDAIDEAQATENFKNALSEAKKQRLNPFGIVQRVKKYGTLLTQENAREARVLDRYYVEVVNLLDKVFTLSPTRREAFLAFLRFQKTLPEINQP